MLLKYFYDTHLAHASYMVGCQRTGEALIVDPSRDITPYLAAAEDEEMKIVGAAETHIHADYVSGARELAERTGATLYVSDEGDANWKYQYVRAYPHRLLKDGDTFTIGNIHFETMHTPGHTPEHISFILTDRGGGASNPMGIFTGDFVFVGSVGRPDLLEKAAGIANTSEAGARQLYRSLQRFQQLPDYLQLWPAHGAGSACGKGLGAIPSSTVGYEKLMNPALSYDDEDAFVEMILDGQPEPPRYFAVMKRVNKEGPALRQEDVVPQVMPETIVGLVAAGEQVVDTRPAAAFAAGHVPGTINIEERNLAAWAGWLVDYERPLTLITPPEQVDTAVRILAEIGVDTVVGYADPAEIAGAGLATETYAVRRPLDVAADILSGAAAVVDVRAQTEWDEGHLPGARHIMLGYLPERANEIMNGRPIVLQCRTGNRSAVAASVLQAQGFKNVINLDGGIEAWARARLPIEKTSEPRTAVPAGAPS